MNAIHWLAEIFPSMQLKLLWSLNAPDMIVGLFSSLFATAWMTHVIRTETYS